MVIKPILILKLGSENKDEVWRCTIANLTPYKTSVGNDEADPLSPVLSHSYEEKWNANYRFCTWKSIRTMKILNRDFYIMLMNQFCHTMEFLFLIILFYLFISHFIYAMVF